MKKIVHRVTRIFLIYVLLFSYLSLNQVFAQQLSNEEFVTYSKKSSFIKEISIPVDDFGLKGIATDKNGDVWLYHSTESTSSIFRFEPINQKISKFDVSKKTSTSDAIISLSGGQLLYDELRNAIWFTDARTNSIGKFDIEKEQMNTFDIPTENAGPMGIILSPDKSKIWFTELSSDKFASLEIKTNEIKEYQIKENSGPTLLAFDEKGSLFITLSYSNSILVVDVASIEPNVFPDISEIFLPKPDFFSPFGIAIFKDSTGVEKLILSDHGSSRVIISDLDSNLKRYTSLWTSANPLYPQTLPSQIDIDQSGNVYFAEHGGNKIAKIDPATGVLTEYDVPTGPLSTVVYLDISEDGKRVWFTEVLANKIGYLDATIPVPFDLQIDTEELYFTNEDTLEQVKVTLKNLENNNSLVSLENINLSLSGMTHSGLSGISYTVNPGTINLNQEKNVESKLAISVNENAESGTYQVMIQASVSEQMDDTIRVSKLYPLTINLDLPKSLTNTKSPEISESNDSGFSIKDIIQNIALAVAIGLSALIVYKRVKSSRERKTSKQEKP